MTNCDANGGVKLLEHGMKIVERITDALFIVRRMQENYREKDKNCTYI